jgi:hypothetical protein
MSARTELACVFPDAETALQVARLLSGNPGVETLPPDGELVDPETGVGVRYDIAAFGPLFYATGETDEADNPVMAPILCAWTGESGWCLIGRWRGPEETVPQQLLPWRVDPETFPVRGG